MARSFIQGLAIVAMLMSCTTFVHATPLPVGGSVLGSTSGNILSTYSGTILATTDPQQTGFVADGGQTVGFITSAVVQPSQGSGLDFVYQLSVGTGSVPGFSISSFQGVSTNVFQASDISDLSATNRFAPGIVQVQTYARSSNSGDTVDLTFASSDVSAGNRSYLVVIHTNSPTFVTSKAIPFTVTYSSPTIISGPSFAPPCLNHARLCYGKELSAPSCVS